MIEFQSAHPVRGATARASSFRSPRPDFNPRTSQTPTGSRRFQSTRPVWGATLDRVQPRDLGRHFNPRAPCGARLTFRVAMLTGGKHFNPRAPCGARPTVSGHRSPNQYFNPRAPCGARLFGCVLKTFGIPFQSTRPVGARQDLPAVLKPVAAISIHAPHGRGGVSAGRPAGRCSHRP